jgi:8-oxo-dGTP pyrophosphatase MutT (NUDIX family)
MRTDHTNISIESPGVNVAVVREDDDGWKFLLLKRGEGESYAGTWGFVTGGKSGNETVAQVVVREVKEETGLIPARMWATEYLVQFYEPEYDKIWILPLIVAVVPPDSKVVLSDENSEFRWLPPIRAKRLVNWKNLVKAIDDVTTSWHLSSAQLGGNQSVTIDYGDVTDCPRNSPAGAGFHIGVPWLWALPPAAMCYIENLRRRGADGNPTMLISICKSKIHRATITDANLNYVGSLTLTRT